MAFLIIFVMHLLIMLTVVGSADPTAFVLKKVVIVMHLALALLDFLPWTNRTIGQAANQISL